jgi:hypothetical protein
MAMATEMSSPTLVVLSDMRNGLPSSSDEREGGDGAVAFVMARSEVLGDAAQVRPLGLASASLEFLDRWQLRGEAGERQIKTVADGKTLALTPQPRRLAGRMRELRRRRGLRTRLIRSRQLHANSY